jgi:hypothetical protein
VTLNLQGSSSIRFREAPAQHEDPRLSFLAQARRTADTPEINELLLALCELHDRIDKFQSKWEIEARKKLEEDFESAKEAVRQHLQRIESAKAEADNAQNSLNSLADKLFRAESALRTAIEIRDGLSPYASKKDIEKVTAAVEDAQARFDEIDSRRALYEAAQRRIALEVLPKLGEELQKLTAQERAAAAALTGESYHDESGLLLPGGTTF